MVDCMRGHIVKLIVLLYIAKCEAQTARHMGGGCGQNLGLK